MSIVIDITVNNNNNSDCMLKKILNQNNFLKKKKIYKCIYCAKIIKMYFSSKTFSTPKFVSVAI